MNVDIQSLTKLLCGGAGFLGKAKFVENNMAIAELPPHEKLHPILYKMYEDQKYSHLLGNISFDTNSSTPHSRDLTEYFEFKITCGTMKFNPSGYGYLLTTEFKELTKDMVNAAVKLAKLMLDNRKLFPEYFAIRGE